MEGLTVTENPAVDRTSTFAVNYPNVVAEVFEGEVVVVDLESGQYFSLAGTGAAIWSEVIGGRTIEQVAQAVVDTHDTGDVDVLAETIRFVAQLLEQNLVVPGPAAADAGERTVVLEARPAFVAPALQIYNDLQDILLLDPIHEVDQAGWPVAPGDGGR